MLDVEASLEHFRQSKALHADTIVVVVEAYFRSLETGRRMVRLGRQLDPARLVLVANKVAGERDLEPVRALGESEGVEVAGAIPYDQRLLDAERSGLAPIDLDPEAPAVAAVARLAERLVPDQERAGGP